MISIKMDDLEIFEAINQLKKEEEIGLMSTLLNQISKTNQIKKW